MRDMSASGLSGVAYFTPIYEVDSLLVTILLVGETSSGDHSPASETVSGAVVSAQDGVASSDGVANPDGVAKSGTLDDGTDGA
jgi:hypothetical protein